MEFPQWALAIHQLHVQFSADRLSLAQRQDFSLHRSNMKVKVKLFNRNPDWMSQIQWHEAEPMVKDAGQMQALCNMRLERFAQCSLEVGWQFIKTK